MKILNLARGIIQMRQVSVFSSNPTLAIPVMPRVLESLTKRKPIAFFLKIKVNLVIGYFP